MKQVEKLLINKPEVAKMIKSLHVVNDANVGETEIMAEGVDLDFLLSQMEMPPGKTIVSTADFRNKPKSIYSRLDSLETLVLEDPRMIGFLDDKRIPFSFLDNLKRLQIYLRQEKLPARGGIWLLSFCKNLKSASLNLSVGREDYRFLKEYSEMFKGLSSVSQLAVEFEMVKGGGYAPPWWVEEEQRSFKGKGGECESVFRPIQNKVCHLTCLRLSFSFVKRHSEIAGYLTISASHQELGFTRTARWSRSNESARSEKSPFSLPSRA